MPTVSELTVKIDADVSGVEKGVAQAEKSVGGLGNSMKSGLGMGLGFGAVGAAIGLVGSAFSAAKGSIIDLNGSLEQSQIAFTTMLGSGEKAETFLKDLQGFAANTPFEFPDLVSASKKMLAFGFESKQVVPLLTAVGDAVAAVGGGADVIEGVTTAIGQMQAKGKVSAEEMGQLAERGIPAWDMLAKKLGVSVADAMDMVSKGQVKAATFVEAFQEGSAERFGGMMEKQSATWSGALSTISDSLKMATAKAFEPFFKLISEGAIQLSKFVQSETFTAWAGAVSSGIGKVVETFRDMIGVFQGSAAPVDRLTKMLSSIFPESVANAIVVSISDLANVFYGIFNDDLPSSLESFKFLLEDFGTILTGLVEEWVPILGAWVVNAGKGLIDNLGTMWVDMVDWIQDTGITIVEKLAAWAGAFLDWVGPMIPDLLRDLGGLAVKVGTWILTDALPTFAKKLLEWGAAFTEWIGPRIPPMLLELGKLLLELGAWILTTALPAILLKLGEWASAFVDWVGPKIPPLLLELGKLLASLGAWAIDTALPAIVKNMIAWGGAFLDWVAKDVIPTLPEKLGAILTAISGWVSEKVTAVATSVKAIGSGILDGIRDGISGALSGFWSWLQSNFVDKIPTFIRELLDIHSPSGVFADIGRNMVEGLRVGMEGRLPSIDKLISDMVGRFGGGGKIAEYITEVALKLGIDPVAALKVAQHEGGTDEPAKRGTFATGSSWWPFQLHYGGKGYEHFGTQAGMGNDFTRQTGWQPGDPAAWKDSIDFALKHAARYGWGAWYGRVPAGVGPWDGIPGHAAGGWVGLNGPELGWLGEKGPEYIVPHDQLGAGGGRMDSLEIVIKTSDREAERVYITGRQLAIRRGRVPSGSA